MNTTELRKAWANLLAGIRQADGGKPSRETLDGVLDAHLPNLIEAADECSDDRLPEATVDRMASAFQLAVRQEATLRRMAAGSSANGLAHGLPWPGSKARAPRVVFRPWAAWAGVAGLAVLVMFGLWLYSLQTGPSRMEQVAFQPGPAPKVHPQDGPDLRSQPKKDLPVAVRSKTDSRRQSPPSPAAPREKPLVAGAFGAVVGEPQVWEPGEKQPKHVLPGMVLARGSLVQTGDTDKLDLKFKDGTVLHLDYNTRVLIPDDESASEIAGSVVQRPDRVTLEAGKLYASVVHLDDEELFRVETPAATAEVLGTSFELGLEQAQDPSEQLRAVLKVREGRVAFFNGLGRVEAGSLTKSQATADSKPSEPERIVSHRSFSFGYYFYIEVGSAPPTPSELLAKLDYPLGTIGARVEETPEGDVWIVDVDPNSPASRAGLRSGSQLLGVNGSATASAATVHGMIASGAGSRLRMRAIVEGREAEFDVTVEQADKTGQRVRNLASPYLAATQPLLFGDAEAAKSRLEAMPDLMRNAAAINNLGVACEAIDEPASAARFYRRAKELKPREALYRLNLASALKAIGNLARAEEESRDALHLVPNLAGAKCALADILSLRGKFDEATQVVASTSPSTPIEQANLAYWRATSLMRAGNLEQAEGPAQAAVQLVPDNSSFRTLLAIILNGQLRYVDAKEQARHATKLDPTNAWAFYMLSWSSSGLGDALFARQCNQRAALLAPKDPEIQGARVSDLFWSDRNDKAAMDEAERLVDLGVAAISTTCYQMLILGRQGRLEEVDTLFWESQDRWPNDPWLLMNRATAYWDCGKRTETIRQLQAAVELYPQLPSLRQGLADRLLGLGRNAEAQVQYQYVVDRWPDVAFAYHGLGSIAIGDGRLDEAEMLYHKLKAVAPEMQRYPNDGWLSFSVAQSLIGAKRSRARLEAKVAEFRAKVDAGGSTEGLENDTAWLAFYLRELGKVAESEKLCRDYLASHPESTWLGYVLVETVLKTRGVTDESYEISLRNSREHPENGHNAGQFVEVLVRRGELKRALEEHRKFVPQWEPKSPRLLDFDEILAKCGRYQDAIKHLRARYRAAPSPDKAVRLAEYEFAHNSLAESFRILREAAVVWPDNLTIAPTLITRFRDNGALPEALAYARSLVKAHPKDGEAWSLLADALTNTWGSTQGGAAEAEAAYRRSIAVRPHPDIWCALGNFCASKGRMEEARKAYEAALKLDPEHDGAHGALFWLDGR